MSNDTIIEGVPSTVLLPSKSKKWKHVSGPHPIDISFGAVAGNDVIAFDLADDLDVLLDLGTLTQAMYLTEVYPSLSEGQVFSVRHVLVDKTKQVVTIVGNILELV